MLLNHSFLHGGFYPKKYHETLTLLYSQESEAIDRLMRRIYGSDTKNIISLIKSSQYEKLGELAKYFRVKSILRYSSRRPWKLLRGLIQSYLYELRINIQGNRSHLNNAKK